MHGAKEQVYKRNPRAGPPKTAQSGPPAKETAPEYLRGGFVRPGALWAYSSPIMCAAMAAASASCFAVNAGAASASLNAMSLSRMAQ